ncbi:hypothetical protein CPB83DRAFT_891647 [Crepidotus variabilis]|uniref:GST N-terminal domain-containing protein n=1 Tax=Crepidotus variabilis TaxID=179855 RepID=A0A9P6JTP2_9AGAR|nr:hypothetical protein CPB83DRAFT_891647 [Crepidotus variabilis]
MTITFYDVPSIVPGSSWSPNTWKTRFCLNYKGLKHKTEWVQWHDLESIFVKIGIPPSGKDHLGRPRYTVPAIFDSTTGIYLSESFEIAQYLDRTYPKTPMIFPNNTTGIQRGFHMALSPLVEPIGPLIIPVEGTKLNPASQECFQQKMEGHFSKKYAEIELAEEDRIEMWVKLKENFVVVHEWYSLGNNPGPFILGETPSWVDFVLASIFLWAKLIFGEDSNEWKEIETWHESRWKSLLSSLSEYQVVC